MYWTWSTYVAHGNTPLTSLPVWMADVVHLVEYYKSVAEGKRIKDAEEKRKCSEMLGLS